MMARAEAKRLDVARLRGDFPGLDQSIRGRPLVYLDNAATTQKPRAVLERHQAAYTKDCANIHRGVHTLSARATKAFEATRARVQRFLGAASPSEIVFTRGTTESINLVMNTFGRANLGPGDEVLITGLEHHSNIVPWQMLAAATGARLVVAELDDQGEVPLDRFAARLGDRTKLAAISHVSNALGTVNPIDEMIRLAKARGAKVLIDGAQAVAHTKVDVAALDCDFYAFSSHKLYGPTGVGVLYGKLAHLEAMPPWQGGGDMIASVSFERSTYAKPPHKFEAGTPDIAGVIALSAAIDYVEEVGLDAIAAHEAELLAYGTARLAELPGLRMIGTARHKAAVLSFHFDDVHPHDLGTILDHEGIAIRTGHHCAQPVMTRFGIPATARASLALYNTTDDLDRLTVAIEKALRMFR